LVSYSRKGCNDAMTRHSGYPDKGKMLVLDCLEHATLTSVLLAWPERTGDKQTRKRHFIGRYSNVHIQMSLVEQD
jgi:hypothetical protein